MKRHLKPITQLLMGAAFADQNLDGRELMAARKLVLQGANLPITPEAESLLHERGVLCIPDFVANAGGVICAAIEYAGGGPGRAFEAIREKIQANTRAVLEQSRETGAPPREAAMALATARVQRAAALQRFRPGAGTRGRELDL